ncbi:hypothetical protein IEQ34_016806 [Dendrobium chrysotoxum]|uniref:RRM domain-containing protein n=1 Tax=Dendrobium chrysotoxum TaxID=161865 RepID=A0AAV7GGA7_DENCH|nr:hypothetical protein IEQ34_016806 [Dendrobium chrysotoxum]
MFYSAQRCGPTKNGVVGGNQSANIGIFNKIEMAFGVRLSRIVSSTVFSIISIYRTTIIPKSPRYSSRSASPYQQSRPFSRSLSRTPSRSRSWSRGCDSADAVNPGNNLYVTGLSSNVSKAELQDHFAREGKVVDVHLVVDPYSRESRGFGFVTMGRIEEAERCIKYLDGSILDGRVITVEKRIVGPPAAHLTGVVGSATQIEKDLILLTTTGGLHLLTDDDTTDHPTEGADITPLWSPDLVLDLEVHITAHAVHPQG